MLSALDTLAPPPARYDEVPWPAPVTGARRSVRSGTPAAEAARHLRPHYARRVRDWLAAGQDDAPARRAALLSASRARLHAAIASEGALP